MNLAKIIELRNTSTHFITEDYEMVYVPLLQSCVLNFVEKMNELHHVDMTEIIPENFITLTTKIKSFEENTIRSKYSKQISEHLINANKNIYELIDQHNSKFAIRLEHHYYNTKNRAEATELYHIAKDADEPVRIIKEFKNPNDTHKYIQKTCILEIRKLLAKNNIILKLNGECVEFKSSHFQMFVKYYSLKDKVQYLFYPYRTAHIIHLLAKNDRFYILRNKERPGEYSR